MHFCVYYKSETKTKTTDHLTSKTSTAIRRNVYETLLGLIYCERQSVTVIPSATALKVVYHVGTRRHLCLS